MKLEKRLATLVWLRAALEGHILFHSFANLDIFHSGAGRVFASLTVIVKYLWGVCKLRTLPLDHGQLEETATSAAGGLCLSATSTSNLALRFFARGGGLEKRDAPQVSFTATNKRSTE